MILDEILGSTRLRVEKSKEKFPVKELLKIADNTPYIHHTMSGSLRGFDGVSIIGEIKKASPSKGIIRPDFDHMEIAREYNISGIQAMSILTEPEFFKGSLEFVQQIRPLTALPLLRKDFIVDEYQLYEARVVGADAVLLIMAALDDGEFKSLHKKAEELELEVLVETHNENEVKRAVEYGKIIGVNNRDLCTFAEDITTCERLIEYIPKEAVTVAESAVRTHEDFEYLEKLGVDAALIGEAFMRESSVKEAVKRLRG